MPKYKPKPVTLSSTLLRWDIIERANRWAKTPPEPPVAAPDPLPSPDPAPAKTKKRSRKKAKKLSAAHRAKLSAALKGRKMSAAARAKISVALRGKTIPPAVRAKMSTAHRGKTIPPAVRAKMSAAHRGKPKSPSHRENISRAMRGERSPAYRHGLYATPTYPIRTVGDVIRALNEKHARLSALLDDPKAAGLDLETEIRLLCLHQKNLSKLFHLQRDRWKAQADETATAKMLADLLREMEEEMMKEEAEKEEKEPPEDKPTEE